MLISRFRRTRSAWARRLLSSLALLMLVTVVGSTREQRAAADTSGGTGDYRLEIHTCSPLSATDNPQTSDPVQVSFGVRKYWGSLPIDTSWTVNLDNPGKDRDANQWDTYRFGLPSQDIANVTNIRLEKTGNDRWCIDFVNLYWGDNLLFQWHSWVTQPNASYIPAHPTSGRILLDGQLSDAPAPYVRFTNLSTSYYASLWNPRLELRTCTTGAQGTRDTVYVEVTHDNLTDAIQVPSGALDGAGKIFALPFSRLAPVKNVTQVRVRTTGSDSMCVDWIQIVDDMPLIIGMPILMRWEDQTDRNIVGSGYAYYPSYQACSGSNCGPSTRMGFNLTWNTRNVGCAAGAASTTSDNNCNGIDDNCDGRIDESFVGTVRPCGKGSCLRNLQDRCESGRVVTPTCDPMLGASAEVCDNRDNNCNGAVDENLTVNYTCGFGVCAESATRSCTGGQWTDSCAPKTCATAQCGADPACRADEAGSCTDDEECDPGLICSSEGRCRRPQCFNGIKDPDEGKIDCGGPCKPCDESACLEACRVGEQVPAPALDALRFKQGKFTRAGVATVESREGKVEQARANELRWVDRDGVRLALFEGAGQNLLTRSTSYGMNPPWIAQAAPQLIMQANQDAGPDGGGSANLVTFPSGPGRGPMQTVGVVGTRSTFSMFASAAPASGSEAWPTARVFALGAGDSVLGTGTFALKENYLRFDFPLTTPANSNASVLLSHVGGWPTAETKARPTGEYYVWGTQLEEQPFPTSFIPTYSGTATRAADDLRIQAEAVRPWFGAGTFQIDVAPLYSSEEMVPGFQYTIFSYGNGTDVALLRTSDVSRLRVRVANNVVHNRPLVWSRGAILTLTFDNGGDKITVAGVGTGNGELPAPGLDLRSSTAPELRIGGVPRGTSEAFAAIGEPRQVTGATVVCTQDPECAVCGDGVVGLGEECEPGLNAYCSSECLTTAWVNECPNCRQGQACPSAPNGAAFGLASSLRICVPIGVDCNVACGDSFDGPCGKCIDRPDCSLASCGSVTKDGTGQVCKGVCAPGASGCLLESDCRDGTHCMSGASGTSQCSEALPTGGLVDKYREPRRTPSGELCFEGPLCQAACDTKCGGSCNLIGECMPRGPQCAQQCVFGCDSQGNCLSNTIPPWPPGEPVLQSDAVPPPVGALSVSDSGTASYSVPLTLPDGVSGHRPELSFDYNSAAGDGALGRGWSLGGMSAISVCETGPRFTSIYRGGPSLCLDGEPLLVKQQSQGGAITYFTGLYESGYVVKGKWELVDGRTNPFPSAGSAVEPHAWVPGREFTVHHEDGRTFYYGHATNDDFLLRGGGDPAMGPSNIRQWLLRSVTDRFGNKLDYRYQKAGVTLRAPELYDPATQRYLRNSSGKPVEQKAEAEAILRWIGYNGGSAEVAFHYVADKEQSGCSNPLDPYCELATDLQLGRWHGGPLGRLMVLSRVDVSVSSRLVRSYGMGYAVTKKGGTRLLKTLQECGYAQGKRSCAPPLEFEYGDPTKSDQDEMGDRLLAFNRDLSKEYVADTWPISDYAQPHSMVFDADGDGRDDFASFNKDGDLLISRGNSPQELYSSAPGSAFPTFFFYKPKEGDEPWYGTLLRQVAAPFTFGYTHRLRWFEEEGDIAPLPAGTTTTDINRDGLTDVVVWGVDETQHVTDIEGSLDDCGSKSVLCGSRKRRHHFKATYPLGVWVYQAAMKDGKLSYSPRRLFHEGFVGDEPGLAAMMPGIKGKDYRGVRVNNNGPKFYPNAQFATIDYNEDGQLDFLYCSNHQDGYGILIESGIGLIHPEANRLLGGGNSPQSPNYKYTLIPGLPLEFCADAQALRTRQGRTDFWSPSTRKVLTSTPVGPALFTETTFGDLDFRTISVRQLERNGDGLPDLAFHREGTDELEFWLNTGTGFVEGHALGFQPSSTIRDCDYKYLGDAAIADIDGNGLDDLVIPSCDGGSNGAPGSLKVHYMHPVGQRVEATLDILGENGRASEDSTPYAVWPGDFDGDGDIDIRFISARFANPWRYRVGQFENKSFSKGASWKLLTRIHSAAVAGQTGSETLISYAAGNGYRREGPEAGANGTPPAGRGELAASCEPQQNLVEVTPLAAGSTSRDPGRSGEREAVYSRTPVAGGCALGGLATCAPRLPFPVVASYMERTADLARSTPTERVWADCTKTQMFYENGKQDSHQGFIGFERVMRRNMAPGAVRSTEASEFDLTPMPLMFEQVLRAGETLENEIDPAIVPRLYIRPFAGLPVTQWLDEPMPSGAMRTTETDYSRVLLRNLWDMESRRFTPMYGESRLPRVRAISDAYADFWGDDLVTAVPVPPLMVVPVLRQNRVSEGKQPLTTTATWWLRNGGGFVDNELSFSSRASTVGDLLSAIDNFASVASFSAYGDLNQDVLPFWFPGEHDMSAVSVRVLKQAPPAQAPATWEGRIGLFGLQGSESATTWARPVSDGRQDVRRFSQTFAYEGNGALRSTTEDNGDGSTYTYTITARASTGAVKAATESATDAWNNASNNKNWSFDLDEYGLYTVAATNPYGQVSKTRFDYASGQPVRTDSADGVIGRATFDGFGRLATDSVDQADTSLSYAWQNASPVTVALPGNPTGVAEVRVNASYRVLETTTRPGFVEVSGETWFDPAGRVVRSGQMGPLGTMVWAERTYDSRGRLAVETRPHANATRSTQGAMVYSYDGLDRPTRVTRPNDKLDGTRWTEAQYGSIGDPGALTTWLSSSARRVRGIRQQTSDATRAALVRTFDGDGRLVTSLEQHQSEAVPPTSTYEIGLGQPLAITGPDGATLKTNFDLHGRSEQTTDPSSGTSSWRYDGFGRVREARDNKTVHRIDYDLLDRPIRQARTYEGTDGAFGANKTTAWEWDALAGQARLPRNSGKLLRISDTAGYADAYTYDGPFALRDSATRTVPRASGGPLTLDTHYEYNPDGRLKVLRHPGGERAQTYRYNERGALKGIDATMNGATSRIWELQEVYEGHMPSQVSLLQGQLSRSYYAGTGALSKLTLKVGQTALVDEVLNYNESGLLEEHSDIANSSTETFSYDRFRRLKERRKASTPTESYSFSTGGRLEQKNGTTLSYTVSGQPNRWPDAVKRAQRGTDTLDYGYHATYGVMTSIRGQWQGANTGLEIAYDLDRQVRQVKWDSGVTRTLGYSPTGDRASMLETGGTAENFVAYAGPHYERAQSGNNFVHIFRFTDAEGTAIVEERVEQQLLPDGTTLEQSVGYQHLARDYRGSVAAILPNGGQVARRSYDLFGGTNTSSRTDLGYTGHRHLQIDGSPLGLIDMGGRMYDPLSGTFTRADPFMPSADTPKGFNRLAYVQGDPIDFVDPTGFWGARPDCNPNGGGCTQPLPPPPEGGGSGGPICNYSCRQAWKDFKSGTKKFFKTITGVQAVQNKRERERRDRRFNRGLFDPQGGGAAPNTSWGIVDQAISALDRNQLRILNVTSEALTGAGDFLTAGGSEWVRNKLFGEGAVRTDSAASYVGAGAGFVIGGGVQTIRAIPSAVRAIPGVVRAVPGAIRAVPGALSAAGQSVGRFFLKHIGIPGVGMGGIGVGGVKGGATIVRLGQEGEAAAGIATAAKTRIPSLTGSAKYRIPDELTETTLREVKNVAVLDRLSQLRDFGLYARQTARQFIVEVRQNTVITPRVQRYLDEMGAIIRRNLE